MTEETPKKPTPEEMQSQLQDFIKDKFGGQVFSMPFPPPGQPGPRPPAQEEAEEEPDREIHFDFTPVEVKAHLDSYVIGQEVAKKILSVAVCDHYNHVQDVLDKGEAEHAEYVKQNVILLGPTGVGKTYLVRTLAQLIGVPFVKADITKFSETGYVGGDVDDLVRELVRAADGDVTLAECGIIFLDEIDKIATSAGPLGRDVSGRGVQTGLLKLLEETEVSARNPFDMAAQMQEMMQASRGGKKGKRKINTKHILFVVSGAFSTLPDIIEKRLTASQVGFQTPKTEETSTENLLQRVMTKDFIEYGFEPEFIGRLPIRVSLDSLTVDDLFNILKHSEGSLIRQYVRNFTAYGMDVVFTDDSMRAIAEQAILEGTGARGLMTVLESSLRDFKFYLPGTEVKRFAITGTLIEDPKAMLARLQKDPDFSFSFFLEAQVRKFETDFLHEHDLRIRFDDSAVQAIVTLAQQEEKGIEAYLEATLLDYVYGLRIIREHTAKEEFILTAENIKEPRSVLDGWVKEALNQ